MMQMNGFFLLQIFASLLYGSKKKKTLHIQSKQKHFRLLSVTLLSNLSSMTAAPLVKSQTAALLFLNLHQKMGGKTSFLSHRSSFLKVEIDSCWFIVCFCLFVCFWWCEHPQPDPNTKRTHSATQGHPSGWPLQPDLHLTIAALLPYLYSEFGWLKKSSQRVWLATQKVRPSDSHTKHWKSLVRSPRITVRTVQRATIFRGDISMSTRLKLKDRSKCVTGKGRSFLGWCSVPWVSHRSTPHPQTTLPVFFIKVSSLLPAQRQSNNILQNIHSS